MRRDALRWFFRRAALCAAPLVGAGCSDAVCSSPAFTVTSELIATDGGACDPSSCYSGSPACRVLADSCTPLATDAGVVALCHFPATEYLCNRTCTGRRPEGLVAVDARPGDTALGAHFARMAHLEAASVDAFHRLADELAAAGAPSLLVDAAVAAARDEVRHARAAGAIAARFGATPAPVHRAPFAPRSIEELAIENEVEGRVFETFGAGLAVFQARHAGDPSIRGALGAIARDEQRHAELAWSVAAWARPLLSEDGRVRVDAARRAAVAQLAAGLAGEPAGELRTVAGVPREAEARALLTAARGLWS